MKKQPTFEEWKEIGNKAKEVRKNLYDLKQLLNKKMPKTHFSLKLWDSAEKAFGKLRSELDEIVCGQNFDVSNEEVVSIFYGQEKNK